MNYLHKDIKYRWNSFSLLEQLTNIGSEVERAIRWRGRNEEYFRLAFYRSLELLFYTINDHKNRSRLKEPTRLYELLADFFQGENIYKSSDKLWRKYFFPYSFAARTNP